MIICFRADASIEIGTGHIMRCLTLAQELKIKGHECHFICKQLDGHLIKYIQALKFNIEIISPHRMNSADNTLTPSTWLKSTQQEDAEDCIPFLEQLKPHWLVVDHYALDQTWERILAPYYQKLLVIDDLADRPHNANILLDQNYGRKAKHYHLLIPDSCMLLVGPTYALLRPEFAELRSYSLKRRQGGEFKNLLLNLGGVDQHNFTTKLLQDLTLSNLPSDFQITVVLGPKSPHVETVQQQAHIMPWHTKVLVGTNKMALLMANHDLAIGAAGSTSWERCCLGLPTIMIVIADNQHITAQSLSKAEATYTLSSIKDSSVELPLLINSIDSQSLCQMTKKSSIITQGRGVETVCELMLNDQK